MKRKAIHVEPVFPIRLFYDGSCSVCAREIEHYLRRDHGHRLIAVDISAPEFNAESHHISMAAFMFELHSVDKEGTVFRGVESFIAIWQAFPNSTFYGFLGTIISLPVVYPLARLLYWGFARIRKYLPKKTDCGSGNCRIGKNG